MATVIDASALLAYLQDEPGAVAVGDCLEVACISSVNLAEVIQKAAQFGVETIGLASELEALGLGIEPFSAQQAEIAASLWPATRPFGLSLADRACLALAIDRGSAVMTTDRAWGELRLDLAIDVIR
ncbi:type II toxin-antitoxin system VapC family toxin [Spiribacter pallidus]|uniref:Type II toxin-antitoxin system VapC family toxin n=1 Tax=Spiribacter pallidus TaxID=1987936 RepID=A0ABV3TAX3_9GAMM